MYWVDLQLAQRKGLIFYQTRCNAIILYDTLRVMRSEEIIYQKVHVSPRPRPKISYKDNWMNELDSEVAGSSKETQRIHPKPNYQVRGDPYVGKSPQRKSRNVICLITRTSSSQQVRRDPYVDQNPQKVALSTHTKTEEDQTRTERPVMVEEHDIDFRVPGLSHAVVKEAEHLRVQELVKKIESHPPHSAKIRRRWSANWVMWSYSSCAKLYQSTMFSLFSLLESRHCVLHLRKILD